MKDLINLTENLDNYILMDGIENDYDLGYYYIEESGCYDTAEIGALSNYIDYESFGRDVYLSETGVYTNQGYLRDDNNTFYEEYDGQDIPDEYKVFSFPKPERNQKNINQNKPERNHEER